MPRSVMIVAASVLGALFLLGGVSLAQPAPQFRSSFQALADRIPDVAGRPLEEEHWTADGDLIQRTTTGLMVWRASDRWTLFTDGNLTWILGPYGLQSRSNDELYPWEFVPPNPSPLPQPAAAPPGSAAPVASAPVAPAPPPPTIAPVPPPPTATPVPNREYPPDVRAMDENAGGHGVMVKAFVQTIEGEWARAWGWRPHRPTTFYLYTDGTNLAYDVGRITGTPVDPTTIEQFAATNAVTMGNDVLTGGWAILMNLSYRWGTEDWEATTTALIVQQYAAVMQTDLAGSAGPRWFREGMAEWMAYSKVGDTPAEKSVVSYAELFNKNGTLPSLMELNDSWDRVAGSDPQYAEASYGASYLAVKYLAGRVGGMPLLQTLQRTAAGEGFDSALQGATGYSISRLESEYRNSIPTS